MTPQQSEVNDPRIGGAKIIFDSRLDKFQGGLATPQQAKDHIRKKQEELPPYTLEDKKQMLIKMLKKDGAAKPEGSGAVVEEVPTPAPASGFQRQGKPAGFKKEAEAAPLYEPEHVADKREAFLLEVAERYNLVMRHLKGHTQATRELLSFIIIGIIDKLESLDDLERFL